MSRLVRYVAGALTLTGLTLAALVLAGCGAPTVHANRAEFCIIYAETKSTVAVWKARIDDGCESKKLKGRICENREATYTGLSLLDEQAKAAIRQADKEVDWATVGKYAELALGLAMKAVP